MRVEGRGDRSMFALVLALLLLAGVAVAAANAAHWPESGDKQKSNGSLVVDATNASLGYIQAKVSGKDAKYKLRIGSGDDTYTYDIALSDGFVVFPLQMGSGSYTCTLYKGAGGKKYTQVGKVKLDVKMEDENSVYLCPSQYVYYAPDSQAVLEADRLCEGLTDDSDKVRAVRDFMKQGFAYDYLGSLTQQKAYLSDVDETFSTRRGLCQDLAVVAASMLRSQGVPTQLVIGYAGSNYHAWNRVLIDGEFRRLDITAELSGMSKDTQYAAERYY